MADERAFKRTVLLAVDASKKAEEAVAWYIKYIHRPDNKVILVHSPEVATLQASQGQRLNQGMIEQMVQKEKEETTKIQTKYVDKLKSEGIAATYKTAYGKAGEAICTAALENHADMIVMGTRGQGTIRRTIMGSVSDFVVHHAHCPVIVCRSE